MKEDLTNSTTCLSWRMDLSIIRHPTRKVVALNWSSLELSLGGGDTCGGERGEERGHGVRSHDPCSGHGCP